MLHIPSHRNCVHNTSTMARKRKARRTEAAASSQQPHNSILIELAEDEKWFDHLATTKERNAVTDEPMDAKLTASLRSQADAIYSREIQLFKETNTGKDDRWVDTTMNRGTLKDRIAAASVVVSTNPITKLHAIDTLLQMVVSTNSRVVQLAAQALEDVFLHTLLPTDRKLVSLSERPLTKAVSPRILLLWRYEELVTEKYESFLQTYISQTLSGNAAELPKMHAVRTAAALLRSLPQGEALLLAVLVNKLGDPERKVAACASHELRRVVAAHSAMQAVIAREVQQLVHRPRLSPAALYNGVCFLNQLQLSTAQSELAESLLSTYFRLFTVAQQQSDKKETAATAVRGRLLSALLMGVNRAHPYLSSNNQGDFMKEHLDDLYRIVHVAPPGACTQALLLLCSLSQHDDRDRYARALYATLNNPRMLSSGKHLTLFFNLLYKSLKQEDDTSRLMALVKRIYAMALHGSPAVLSATLLLLRKILIHHPILATTFCEVLRGPNALRVVDPTKREPRGALVAEQDESNSNNSERLAPGWELALTMQHYHPSVQQFAKAMNDGKNEKTEYTGDPLHDFALAPFLDKFAYRNPKKTTTERSHAGSSIAERRSALTPSQQHQLPVNDPSFFGKRGDKTVDVRDEFFREFFVERAKRDDTKGIVRQTEATDRQEAELDLLDKVEVAAVDHHQAYEDFESQWETDEEEEDFVDSLAQKIIEDAVDDGEGPADLDDEDPDMEDWGDMRNSDSSSEEDTKNASDDVALPLKADDVDAFMDETDSSSDSEGARGPESEEDPEDSSSDEQDDLAFAGGSSEDDDDNNAPQLVELPEVKGDGIYAAAEDYEELIAKSWNSQKRETSSENVDEGNVAPKSRKKKKSKHR